MKASDPYKNTTLFFWQTGILLLIVLWLYTALSKVTAYAEFRYQLGNQIYPISLLKNAAFLIIAIEFITALLLFFLKTRVYGLQVSLILITAFTIYTFLVLVHAFPRIPCSCGGILRAMSWKVHFFFNLGFFILNAFCLYTHKKGGPAT